VQGLRNILSGGEGPRVAAHQAAALFALAGVLALVALPTDPTRSPHLIAVAVADLATCGATLAVPWHRFGRNGPLVLALPGFAILSVSTWVFGGVATGTGPFFVLLFAWVGLHFPAWSVLALALPALVAYTVPLVLTGNPPEVLASGVVLIPTAVGIGLLIGRQVAYQRKARQEIERVERWRAALTATLAHDVRSPLTSVHAALQVLRSAGDDLPAARQEAIISSALRQTARIRRLATGLLDVERVERNGELKLDLREVGLRDAVDEAVTYLGAGDAGTVVVDIPPDLVAHVDPQRLEQMVINLATNALRHGAPPVVVSAHRDGPLIMVDVRDHGEGVPADRRAELFTEFRGSDRGPDSVGLGLWVVRQLARAHGGDVRYEHAGPGARFVLDLPDQPAALLRNADGQQLLGTAGAR
jgi:signal transduction histidine kinase